MLVVLLASPLSASASDPDFYQVQAIQRQGTVLSQLRTLGYLFHYSSPVYYFESDLRVASYPGLGQLVAQLGESSAVIGSELAGLAAIADGLGQPDENTQTMLRLAEQMALLAMASTDLSRVGDEARYPRIVAYFSLVESTYGSLAQSVDAQIAANFGGKNFASAKPAALALAQAAKAIGNNASVVYRSKRGDSVDDSMLLREPHPDLFKSLGDAYSMLFGEARDILNSMRLASLQSTVTAEADCRREFRYSQTLVADVHRDAHTARWLAGHVWTAANRDSLPEWDEDAGWDDSGSGDMAWGDDVVTAGVESMPDEVDLDTEHLVGGDLRSISTRFDRVGAIAMEFDRCVADRVSADETFLKNHFPNYVVPQEYWVLPAADEIAGALAAIRPAGVWITSVEAPLVGYGDSEPEDIRVEFTSDVAGDLRVEYGQHICDQCAFIGSPAPVQSSPQSLGGTVDCSRGPYPSYIRKSVRILDWNSGRLLADHVPVPYVCREERPAD